MPIPPTSFSSWCYHLLKSFLFPNTDTMIKRFIAVSYYGFGLPLKICKTGEVEITDSLFRLTISGLIAIFVAASCSAITARLLFYSNFNFNRLLDLWHLMIQVTGMLTSVLFLNTFIKRHEIVGLFKKSRGLYQNFQSK